MSVFMGDECKNIFQKNTSKFVYLENRQLFSTIEPQYLIIIILLIFINTYMLIKWFKYCHMQIYADSHLPEVCLIYTEGCGW